MRKSIYIIYFLISLILCSILITVYLFYDFSKDFNLISFEKIIVKIGFKFGFLFSSLLFILILLLKKLKNNVVKVIVLCCFSYAFYLLYHFFFWYVGISGLLDNFFE